jgi:hypothetical protein
MSLEDVGRRVRVIRWAPSEIIDDNETVPPGTEGTVTYSDGDEHHSNWGVKWDNGATLGFAEEDDWEFVDEVTDDG